MLKIINRINSVADYVNAVLFAVIAFGVLVAVFGRYLFRIPIPAAMELAYFAMLWCAFLKTGQALFEDRHIGMALLKGRLHGKAEASVGIIINAVVLVPSLYMGAYASKMAWEAWIYGWRTSGGLPMPQWALYGAMALGSFYLVLIASYKIWGHITLIIGKNNGR